MNNNLHNFSTWLLLLVIGCMHYTTQAQDLASCYSLAGTVPISPQKTQTRTLKSILVELETKYNVSIVFNSREIGDQLIEENPKQTEDIDMSLKKLLAPIGLTFKKLDKNIYVIQAVEKKIDKIEPNEKSDGMTASASAHLIGKLTPRQIMPDKLFEQVIAGTVTDGDSHDPLPGVNILAKGTSTGTVTDAEGKYRLSIGDDVTTLIFSSIGYTSQEIAIGGRSVIDVVMAPDVQALSEVVVVGYGTQKKSDLTGAVATVKSEELLDRQPINVTQALQGRIPGVDVFNNTAAPGAASRVRIRGLNSINSSIDPLYVVDGVIGVSPDALDPNNIESVEVLKDASATAIYGARGANGVILITTKRGMEGSLISYEGFGSYSVPSRSVARLNAQEFMEVYNLAFDNAAKYDPQGYADGKYVRNDPKDFPNLFDANGNPLYDTDWEAEIYRPAFSQNHHLSVQGGAEKTTYSVSLGYTDQDGIMRNSAYNRYNAKFTLDNQVRDWLRIGGTVTGLKSKQIEVSDANGGLNVPRMVFEALPIIPIKYPDGNWGRNKD